MEAHRVAATRAAVRAEGTVVWTVVRVGAQRVAEEDALGGPQARAADEREEVVKAAGAVMEVETEAAPKEEEVGELGGRLEHAADATVETGKAAAVLEAGQLAARKVARMEAQRVAAAREAARAEGQAVARRVARMEAQRVAATRAAARAGGKAV